jgi:hypothetical protein
VPRSSGIRAFGIVGGSVVNELLALEVVEWLEKLARGSNPFDILSRMAKKEHLTTEAQSLDFSRLPSEGIIDVQYRLPKSAIQRYVKLTDEEFDTVKEYIGTIPEAHRFKIEVSHEEIGDKTEDVIVIHQRFKFGEADRKDIFRSANNN